MKTTTMVLLRKIRRAKFQWEYVVNGQKFLFTSEGDLFEQFFNAVEDVKSQLDDDVNLVIMSPSLITMVEEPIREIYPDILFVKLNDSTMTTAFERAFNVDVTMRRANARTLFIGADASGGHQATISAWAWATHGVDGSYGMGICEFRDNNMSEFEGILRAIIENKDAPYEHFHIYSDSKNAIGYFEESMKGVNLDIIGDSYLADLVDEVRFIAQAKKVTIGWVRGHRQHRLNMAADVISRHARKSAQSGKNVKTMMLEADAMFALFNQPHTR